jgi:glucose-1-phosphate cytidylyltransferase
VEDSLDSFRKDKKVTIDYTPENWKITFIDTGLETNTGGRIKKIEKEVEDTFFATYSDGLSDLNLNSLLKFHRRHGRIATLTAVRPRSPFGILDINSGTVTNFREKPKLDNWINGGFFVFETEIFDYIKENDVLERGVFKRLVKNKNLVAYRHKGFWKCMDTYKDDIELNEIWNTNNARWRVWKRE